MALCSSHMKKTKATHVFFHFFFVGKYSIGTFAQKLDDDFCVCVSLVHNHDIHYSIAPSIVGQLHFNEAILQWHIK